ncbi:MAG: DNA recombination protein RmuC [Dehalococcoidia bacterium]|nr:DNA recombination protein RmuC [Dehalococcoidia bacterium]
METILIILIGGLIVIVTLALLRSQRDAGSLSASLQTLTQAMQQGQAQMGAISEKVVRLEGLVDATSAIRSELSRAKDDLTQLQAYAKARHELELRTADSIRRLEAIIAGTQSKGAAGENILEVVLAKLPPEWQARNFRVGNKVVEFGLRLPNNLVLPIDSKWTATHLLEQFAATDDPGEKHRLKGQIETTVLDRAKEVRKYIDPNVTLNFAVAVVPDAIYDLCCGIQTDAFHMNVVLISYSMFIPYLVLVFQTVLKASRSIDLQKLNAYLENVEHSLMALQEELEGRFSRALTMLNNSRSDMAMHLSKVRGDLTSLQIGAPASSNEDDLPEGGV